LVSQQSFGHTASQSVIQSVRQSVGQSVRQSVLVSSSSADNDHIAVFGFQNHSPSVSVRVPSVTIVRSVSCRKSPSLSVAHIDRYTELCLKCILVLILNHQSVPCSKHTQSHL